MLAISKIGSIKVVATSVPRANMFIPIQNRCASTEDDTNEPRVKRARRPGRAWVDGVLWLDCHFRSWEEIVDFHGAPAAFMALTTRDLPYREHPRDGHLEWPHSHQFLMEREGWNEECRDEIGEYDEDDIYFENMISRWIIANQPAQTETNPSETYREMLEAGAFDKVPHEHDQHRCRGSPRMVEEATEV